MREPDFAGTTVAPKSFMRKTLGAWRDELIERLKPASEFDVTISEWRQFVILTDRYVRHRPLWEIQDKLSLGERQMRREHQRALQALSMLLQAHLGQSAFVARSSEGSSAGLLEEAVQRLTPSPCVFDLATLIADVTGILIRTHAADSKDAPPVARVSVEPSTLKVFADRGICHQLLLKLAQLFDWKLSPSDAPKISAVQQEARACITLEGVLRRDDDTHSERLRLCQWLAESLGTPLAWAPNRVSFVLPTRVQAHKVLIVDDEPSALELFQSYLSGLNFDVVTESKPENALLRVASLQPMLVVLDVMMPAMDGWEVLQRLRHMPEMRDVPIVACSVLNDAELAGALGASRFLKKPVLRQQLIRVLNELLNAA